jgi:hypothetical protein
MGTVSDSLSLCYLFSKGVQTKYLNTFLIEDFFNLPLVSMSKFETALMGYSGASGILIHEKT